MNYIKNDNGNIEISFADFNDLLRDQAFLQAYVSAC